MASNGQVIKAAQMFLKQGAGASKNVNLKAEILAGLLLAGIPLERQEKTG